MADTANKKVDPLPGENVPPPFEKDVEGQTYKCTSERYSLTANAAEIATLSPGYGKLWPGVMLTGNGYAGGLGTLQELPFPKRTPITIVTSLLGPSVSRTVASPNAGTVGAAIGDLAHQAEAQKVPIGGPVAFEMRSASSLKQAFLQLGLSANFVSGEASASLAFDELAAESAVVVMLRRQYFSVAVAAKPTPADFFGPGFTLKDIAEQERLGRINKTNNPAVMVKNVTYGEIFLLTVTSKVSREALSGALSASFSTVAGGIGGRLDAGKLKILQDANVRVAANGGDPSALVAALKQSDKPEDVYTKLEKIFANPRITTARPLSYQVDYFASGQPAKFSETERYNLTTCTTALKIGEIAKLTNLVLHPEKPCGVFFADDYNIFGWLRINGSQVFFLPPDSTHRVTTAEFWSIPIEPAQWPLFQLADPRFVDLPTFYPQDGFYVAVFFDEKYGPKNPQLRLEGRIEATRLFGNTVDVYNIGFEPPYVYGEQSDAGASRCPVKLFYTLEKFADIKVKKEG